MASKTYKSTTGMCYTFPVVVSTVKIWIEMNPSYTTSVSGVQSAIEAHAYYTSGQIAISGVYVPSDATGGATATTVKTKGTGYVQGDIVKEADDLAVEVTAVGAAGIVNSVKVINAGTGLAKGDQSQVSTTSTAGLGLVVTVDQVGTVAAGIQTKEFDCTTVNAAAAILRADPYWINYTKLRTPKDIVAQGLAVGVSFPSLII